MPGAPNRPPETTPTPAPPVDASTDELRRRVLRRLAPARIALHQDSWKAGVPPDVAKPFDRAEAAYIGGDFRGTESALDQLSVRLAEPRWPTLPAPFRELRVAIPAPMPPHWDPEFALTPEVKEAHKTRRNAELQLALATASLEWAKRHQIDLEPHRAGIDQARQLLTPDGAVPPEFWTPIDQLWEAVRRDVPPAAAAGARPAPPAAEPIGETG